MNEAPPVLRCTPSQRRTLTAEEWNQALAIVGRYGECEIIVNEWAPRGFTPLPKMNGRGVMVVCNPDTWARMEFTNSMLREES